MSLQQEIEAWDGKATAPIEATYGRYAQSNTFLATLIPMIADVNLQTGATWLLKKHVENGNPLSPAEIDAIYVQLPQAVDWETKLHLLQCVPYMPISDSQVERVEQFLRECLLDKAKFVRAWAYNGFHELAMQYPAFAAESKQLLEAAMQNEAASVKARIRNLLKKR